jgi:hypothetical protein
MSKSRPLVPLEHTVEILNQLAASFNVVTVSRIQGRLDATVLRKAIYLLQQRHPLLNYCIDGELKGQLQLQPQTSHYIPVTIAEGEENDWQDAVFAELNTKIESHLGLIRVVLVTQAKTQTHHLITTLHHAISDGLSTIHLHRDILTYCHHILADQIPTELEPLPILPSVEALMPLAHQGRRGKLSSLFFLFKLKFNYLYYQPKTLPFEQTVDISSRRCGFVRRELSPEITTQLIDRCRQEKTTVQGVLCAAMLLSIATHLRTPKQPQVPAVCRTYTDIRRRLNPPIDPQHLGFLAGAIASFHHLNPDRSLWELAREVRQQLQTGLAKGDDFHIVRQAKTLAEALLAQPNQAPITVEVTNVGRVDIPTTYGPLVLEDISYCLPQAVFGAVYTVTATTFRNRMVLNFMYSIPSIREQTIATLSQDTITQILNALHS